MTWVFFAFLSPFMWAIVNILNVYLSLNTFHSPYEASILRSLHRSSFCFLALLGMVSFEWPGMDIAIIAIAAGMAFQVANLFYFKSLFKTNDVVFLQVLFNLNIIVIPILGYIFLNSSISMQKIVGIFVVFIASSILYKKTIQIDKKTAMAVFVTMMGYVLFTSFSRLMMEWGFNKTPGDFMSIYVLYSFGVLIISLLILINERNLKFFTVLKTHPLLIACVAFFELCAILSFQRATSLSPNVTYVAVIDTFTPVFIIIICVMFIALCSVLTNGTNKLAESFLKFQLNNLTFLNAAILPQIANLRWKVFVTFLMLIGVYLIIL